MTNVSNIQSNMSGISAGFARTGIFNSALGKPGGWRGGAKHAGLTAPNPGAPAANPVKAEEPLSPPAALQVEGMRKFFGGNSAYFPPVDYYQAERETRLFESLRDKAGFSSNWRQALS